MTFTADKIADRKLAPSAMLEDVIEGLGYRQKALPSKYFYDDRGSHLFEKITQLGEYYLTRAESQIMRRHADEMARTIGDNALLVEYGSGSSKKTRALLDALHSPAGYVPVDISGEYLASIAADLRSEYESLPVLPVIADFTTQFEVPEPPRPESRRVAYFPGSTIGNFARPQAVKLLAAMSRMCGKGGAILVGVDLEKDETVVSAAYNDSLGVTAEFNLNMLRRINRELGADFDTWGFTHRATYNRAEARIEMYLLSERHQYASVGSRQFEFQEGESILTEYSHKYSLESFAALASQAGLTLTKTWIDDEALFGVHLLEQI